MLQHHLHHHIYLPPPPPPHCQYLASTYYVYID